jgi:hypothetical protein
MTTENIKANTVLAEELLRVYSVNRGTGHTITALTGIVTAKNDKSLHNRRYLYIADKPESVANILELTDIMSSGSVIRHSLRGYRGVVIVDHVVITDILQALLTKCNAAESAMSVSDKLRMIQSEVDMQRIIALTEVNNVKQQRINELGQQLNTMTDAYAKLQSKTCWYIKLRRWIAKQSTKRS